MTAKELFYARQFREEGMSFRRIGIAFGVTRQAVHEALRANPRAVVLYLTPEEKLEARKRNAGNSYRRKCGLKTL